MAKDVRDKHVVDCESALGCWHSRRSGDLKGYVVPRQNISQVLSRLKAMFDCLEYMENTLNVDFRDIQVLDVGAASGIGLIPFLEAGFSMNQLNGIDLFEERVNLGREKYPGLKLSLGDATKMDIYADKQFDMTMEQFCFCHIDDDAIVARIAEQMLRVTKPGGYIWIMDWIIGSKKIRYNGVSKKKIESVFKNGMETEIIRRFPVKLAPPIGRIVSRYVPTMYPLIVRMFPCLVLARLTLLRRKHPQNN